MGVAVYIPPIASLLSYGGAVLQGPFPRVRVGGFGRPGRKPMKTTAASTAIERNGWLERCGDGGSEAGAKTSGRRGVEVRGEWFEGGRGDEEAM